jgi:hypothetical protein
MSNGMTEVDPDDPFHQTRSMSFDRASQECERRQAADRNKDMTGVHMSSLRGHGHRASAYGQLGVRFARARV